MKRWPGAAEDLKPLIGRAKRKGHQDHNERPKKITTLIVFLRALGVLRVKYSHLLINSIRRE